MFKIPDKYSHIYDCKYMNYHLYYDSILYEYSLLKLVKNDYSKYSSKYDILLVKELFDIRLSEDIEDGIPYIEDIMTAYQNIPKIYLLLL